MKTDRLIGIITTIQQKALLPRRISRKNSACRAAPSTVISKTSAKPASRSRLTKQGAGGGISIMEGFSLDAAVLTRQELSAVLTGCARSTAFPKPLHPTCSPQSSAQIPIYRGTWRSISRRSTKRLGGEDRDDPPRRKKRRAASCFTIITPKGRRISLSSPIASCSAGGTGTFSAFCPACEDFRLYKLRRLWNLNVTDEFFTPREVPPEKEPNRSRTESMTDDYIVTAVYEPAVKYRLVEEYGPASFITREDGKLYTEWGFSTPEDALRWLLSLASTCR